MECKSQKQPGSRSRNPHQLLQLPSDYECKQIVRHIIESLYEIDAIIDENPEGQTASSLWGAAHNNLALQLALLTTVFKGTYFPIPRHIVALTAEFQNLIDGVPSRLLRHDGDTMGNNSRDGLRLAIQTMAAVLLQLFMDRDGKGRQKIIAARIAKVLTEAGFTPPGRDGRAYTARTVIEWLRMAKNNDDEYAEFYREMLNQFRKKVDMKRLEEELDNLSETVKRFTFRHAQ
jgi:hypothetical protein